MSTKKKNDKFVFWMPCDIEKAQSKKDSEEVVMRMKGIASTLERDSDGEILDPEGFELDFFLKSGMVNWHHQAKDKPLANIGEPTVAEIVPEGLYVELDLYSDSALAQEVYQLGEILQKNSKTRRLGFSIEGKVLSRDPLDETRITKARITGLAITHIPKNPATLCEIMKGERDGFDMEWDDEEIAKATDPEVIEEEDEEEDENKEKALDSAAAAPLVKESLDKKVFDQTEMTKYLSKGEVFSKIFSDFPDIALPKSKQVYRIIEKISENMNNGKSNQITNDAISKAYEVLGIPSGDSIEKGGSGEEHNFTNQPANGGKTTYYRELEKGGEFQLMYKGEAEDGSQDTPADDKVYIKKGDEYVEKGEGSEEGSAAEPAGDNVEKGEGEEEKTADTEEGIEKAQNNELGAPSAVNEIVKAMSEMTSGNAEIFKAMGTLLKGVMDNQNAIMERLTNVEETPAPVQRKSLANAHVAERFAKGENGEELGGNGKTVLSLRQHRGQIVKALNDATFEKGGFNKEFANALAVFEASGEMPADVRSSLETAKSVKIVD